MQLIKTPTLREFKVSERAREGFKAECFARAGIFKPRAEAVREFETLERTLLEEGKPVIDVRGFGRDETECAAGEVPTVKRKARKTAARSKKKNLFDSLTMADEPSEE